MQWPDDWAKHYTHKFDIGVCQFSYGSASVHSSGVEQNVGLDPNSPDLCEAFTQCSRVANIALEWREAPAKCPDLFSQRRAYFRMLWMLN